MELHERLGAGRRDGAPTRVEPFAELKTAVHLQVIGSLGPQLFNLTLDHEELKTKVLAEIRQRLQAETGISRDDRERLTTEIADDILGYGPLERLLADDSITEIMVNGPGEIWIERQGRLYETTVRFTDESHLRRIINRIVAQVGRRIDEASPMVDARLPDGSRVNAIIPPLSLSGPLLTIRKFSRKRLTLVDMVNIGTLSDEAVEFLQMCVRAELNILISGGTGTGKTTLLNALSAAIPDSDRIVTIEDAAELQLQQRHVLRLESRPRNIEGEGEVPIRMLVRNALRMRPDRILVGEVRGAETVDMLQAMNTGHDGSLTTVHANSPRDGLHRIETMVLMAGIELPVRAIRQQTSSALDLIIHLDRMDDGSRKVSHITEVQRMESDVITLQDLFEYKIESVAADRTITGRLYATGLRPVFLHKFQKHGIELPGRSLPSRRADDARVEGRSTVRRLALLALTALVAVVAVVAALPASAAQSGPTLSESSARFPDRYYFLTLPKPQRLTAGNVRVTENGAPVRNLAVTRPGEQGFVTYLVVDASNSMRGKPIADAMKAARVFAAQRNPNSPLGVVFFNDNVTVALRPTRNAQDINEVLAKPPVLREKTHLYDALDKTSDELLAAGAPGGAIVLLSDGDDVGSKATQEVAVSRLKQQKARVFGVGLRSGAYTPDALQAFAAETGGSYAETGQSAQLTGIFDALGFKLSNEYLLLWRSQAGPEKKINVAVRVAGYPQPVTTSYTTPSLGLTIEPLDKSFVNKLVQSWLFLLLVVAAVMGLLFWGIRSVVEARQRNLRTRMAMFVEVGGHPAGHEHPDFAARVDQVDQALSKRGGRLGRFSDMCEVGSVGVSPTVLLVGSIGGGFILGVILAVAFGPVWFLTAVVPYLAVRWYVKNKLGRVRRTFAEQLPDNLEVLAGALRAGHSLVGGFSVMADHAAPPSGKEFKRVVTDEQVGIPLEDSLRVVGQRMDSRDMSQVAMIALLQRETGSSSAEVIDQVAENVRGRLEVRRLVRVLTAQGRMARWIVSLMPLVLVFLILGINPEFLEPLFHTTVGVVAVIIATIMVIMGSLVIKRIVEIKV